MVKNNILQSAFALHILKNWHEYGPMYITMNLLKPPSTRYWPHMNSSSYGRFTKKEDSFPNKAPEETQPSNTSGHRPFPKTPPLDKPVRQHPFESAHISLPDSPEPQQRQQGTYNYILYLPTNLLKKTSPHITPDLSLLQNWILSLVYHDLHTTRLPYPHNDINPPTLSSSITPHPTPYISLIPSHPTPKPQYTQAPIMIAQYYSVDHNTTLFYRTTP